MLSYKILDWDSQFFGFPVAMLSTATTDRERLGKLLNDLKSNSVHLAYWNCLPSDQPANNAAQANGGVLVDRKCTYALPLGHQMVGQRAVQIENVNDNCADRPALIDLALQSAIHSRFKTDVRMPENSWIRLYTAWMEKSLSGELADIILVERIDGHPVGMLTLSTGAKAKIGLIAVDANQRGRGIAKRLLHTACQEAANAGCREISVITQGNNNPACFAYERVGFRRQELLHTYHFWLD